MTYYLFCTEHASTEEICLKGIEFFLETGFIASRSPQDIAKFLHETDGLSKAMIGEYLGEGYVPLSTSPVLH